MFIDTLYLNNLTAVLILMFVGWLLSLARKNVTVVDSLWGLGFVLIAWLTLFSAEGYRGRQLLIVALTTLWGVRLTAYLTWRNHGKGEDPRYAAWREAGGREFWIVSLFKVFLLQALFLWVIALPIQAGQTVGETVRLGWFDLAGAIVWLVGFTFETLGDWQLARFKSKPNNHGKVMDRGLWQYTRHPNYFGEFLVWWGHFIIVLSIPGLWWTVISPVVVTLVLMKMTGVPLTEKLLLEKKPGYRQYIQTTPAFFPGLARRKHNLIQ